MRIHFQLSLGIFFNELYEYKKITVAAKIILKLATCNDVKPIKPFLIKIKELPQINDKMAR